MTHKVVSHEHGGSAVNMTFDVFEGSLEECENYMLSPQRVYPDDPEYDDEYFEIVEK